MKTCPICETPKDETAFRKWKASPDGLSFACKQCRADNYNVVHDALKALRKAGGAPRKSRVAPDTSRGRDLKYRYGISEDDYARMLAEQKGMCPICTLALVKPSIDHCHDTGLVRGILCRKCNAAIGLLGDNPANAMRAYHYLNCN